jgi:hypothetical protein
MFNTHQLVMQKSMIAMSGSFTTETSKKRAEIARSNQKTPRTPFRRAIAVNNFLMAQGTRKPVQSRIFQAKIKCEKVEKEAIPMQAVLSQQATPLTTFRTSYESVQH